MSLPAPPRTVEGTITRALMWGSHGMLFAQALTLLVSTALLFLLLLYHNSFSAIRARYGPTKEVTSQVQTVNDEWLASGGKTRVATAPVKINETVLEVKGYGPAAEQAKVGDEVTLIIPTTRPAEAYLKGFWPQPVSPRVLLQFALVFYLPGWIVGGISLVRARTQRRLLIEGEEVKAEKRMTLPLPRPLKDKVLARWTYHKGQHSFWCLQDAQLQNETVLARGPKAVLLESLPVQLSDQKLVSQGKGVRIRAMLVKGLAVFHLGLWFFYLLAT